MQTTVTFVPFVFFVCFLYLLYRGATWAAADARLRGKSPWLVLIAVLFFFPWGLIAWLLFRPDPPNQLSPGPFDIDDFPA